MESVVTSAPNVKMRGARIIVIFLAARQLVAGAQICASRRIYTIRRWRPPAGAIDFLSASSIQV